MDRRSHNGRNKNSQTKWRKATPYGNAPSRWNGPGSTPTPLTQDGLRKQREWYEMWNYRYFDLLRHESEHRRRR